MGGKPWTLAIAQTDSALSDSAGFWVNAYADAVSPACSAAVTPVANWMILTVPTQPGDYPLGASLTATFVTASSAQNLVATTGHVVVESVSGGQLVGGAYIEHDATNSVSGRFTIGVCP